MISVNKLSIQMTDWMAAFYVVPQNAYLLSHPASAPTTDPQCGKKRQSVPRHNYVGAS